MCNQNHFQYKETLVGFFNLFELLQQLPENTSGFVQSFLFAPLYNVVGLIIFW
jgi:hypothetical protein